MDISLDSSEAKDGTLHLTEDGTNNVFVLKLQADGDWQGTWSNGKGRTLPVHLHRAVLPPLPEHATIFMFNAYYQDPYDYLRIQHVRLHPGHKQQFEGHTLDWITEPVSGFSIFQVESGYTPKQQNAINSMLRSWLLSQVESYYECGSSVVTYYDVTATPTSVSNALVSASVEGDASCGGAHPTHSYDDINLNAQTGKVLSLDDVVSLPAGRQPHPGNLDNSTANQLRASAEAASNGANPPDPFTTYRDKVFAPWLIAN